jgi:hypothetical protein
MRAVTFSLLAMSMSMSILLLSSCEKLGPGFNSKPTPSSSTPATASTPDAASPAIATTETTPSSIPPAADANTPTKPEHLVVRVAYLVDAGTSESTLMELEREGRYRLERRGGETNTSDVKDLGSACSGTLSPDVGGALWKAVDAAAFVPSESGFSKPIQAPRQQQQVTQQARYSVTRMLADLSMVPADEAGARALVQPLRAAISTAEKQSASSGTCTKIPRR